MFSGGTNMKWMYNTIIALAVFMLVASAAALAVAENDLTDNPGDYPAYTVRLEPMAATSETTVDNGDGTFTYTQIVDESSTSPHYIAPNGYGFEIYSWYDEDYGWKHTFLNASEPGIVINSVNLMIRAWDVDSEPYHGWEGEYDHITGDGVDFDPVYLQGTNNAWSETVFDVAPSLISDGEMDIWMDIDMHHKENQWATTLDKSVLTVEYSTSGNNTPPYAPELSVPSCVANTSDLRVSVIGPNPADPDMNDSVTYTYRWFVDIGTGGYIEDEFAGRGDHVGDIVPAADTMTGDLWMVRVTATDSHGARTFSEIEFPEVTDTCNQIPEFPAIALPVLSILGLAFIFQRRKD